MILIVISDGQIQFDVEINIAEIFRLQENIIEFKRLVDVYLLHYITKLTAIYIYTGTYHPP